MGWLVAPGALVGLYLLVRIGFRLAERYVQGRVLPRARRNLEENIGGTDTTLEVTGDPLVRHLLRREVPAVTVTAKNVPLEDGRARLRHAEVTFEDLEMFGVPGKRRVTAEDGRFTVHITDAELLKLVDLPADLVSFSIVPTGLDLEMLKGVHLDAKVEITRRRLRVRPEARWLRMVPYPAFTMRLPELPYGAQVTRVKLHRGWLEAHGTFDPNELDFALDNRHEWDD